MSKGTRIHYSGYATTTPAPAAGTACRPDGEYGRVLTATFDTTAVTCRACLRLI